MKVAYYGGSFDPVHEAHFLIIKNLSENFDKVILQVSHNWTKPASVFSLSNRERALSLLVKDLKNVEVLLNKPEDDNSSTYLVVKKIESYLGIKPVIVIGSDNVSNIEKWKKWEELKNYNWRIYIRSTPVENFKAQYETVDLKIPNISSTEIRKNINKSQVPEKIRDIYEWDKLNNMIKK